MLFYVSHYVGLEILLSVILFSWPLWSSKDFHILLGQREFLS